MNIAPKYFRFFFLVSNRSIAPLVVARNIIHEELALFRRHPHLVVVLVGVARLAFSLSRPRTAILSLALQARVREGVNRGVGTVARTGAWAVEKSAEVHVVVFGKIFIRKVIPHRMFWHLARHSKGCAQLFTVVEAVENTTAQRGKR